MEYDPSTYKPFKKLKFFYFLVLVALGNPPCFHHSLRKSLYLETDYRLSYFSTKEGSEVDLILSRGREIIFIEIRSSTQVDLVEFNKLNAIAKGHTKKAYYLSCDPHSQKIENVMCLPWQKGLSEIFKL